MNKGVKIGLAALCTAAIAGGGYGAYALFGSDSASSSTAAPKPRTVVAGSPAADQAAKTAKAFLDDWSKGDLQAASALTDAPDVALAALMAFKSKVNPSALTLNAESGPPTGKPSPKPSASASGSASASASATPSPSDTPADAVVLGYQAKAEFADTSNAWNYEGALGLVKMSDDTAAVHWSQKVLNPQLGTGESIAVQPIASKPGTLLDRHGKPLAKFDSLRTLLAGFKPPAPNPADAGLGVVITDDAGGKPAQQLFTITDPKPEVSLKLTIDANLQAAAEDAVKKQTAMGGLVAIEPSTGQILAVANNPATGFDRAFLGGQAPGSTMKIITAAALLEAGVGPNDPMPCPASVTVAGQTVTNDSPADTDPSANFAKSFAISCNAAFIQTGMSKLAPGAMETTAKEVFGLGTAWKTGIPMNPAKVPVPTGANARAAQLFGQGQLLMNPLAMASVAATVQNGTFHQPILVPGMDQVPATRQLSPANAGALRQLMQGVTTGAGTAAGLGLPSGSGAKTGTAQVSNQAKSNSWFTAFYGDLAVAAEFENAGHGADAAGPAVAEVLKLGNQK